MPVANSDTVVDVPVPVVVAPPGLVVIVHVPVEGSPLRTTLPVASVQLGWVIVPTMGAVGVAGCVLITTCSEGNETQPSSFVTVKVYVPEGNSVIVVLVPVPVAVTAPGFRVRVQVPVSGKPFKTTLPVATAHVGWVMVPTTGAGGDSGWLGMITFADSGETQPCSLVTVKLYVPVGRFVIVVLVPVPVVVTPPVYLVIVHVPVDGRPLKTTLPVGSVHVGAVIAPTTGAVGVGG